MSYSINSKVNKSNPTVRSNTNTYLKPLSIQEASYRPHNGYINDQSKGRNNKTSNLFFEELSESVEKLFVGILNIKEITGTQLTSDLEQFLIQNGTNIKNYNDYIFQNVKKNGIGTREGVVAAAVSLFSYLDKFGYRPRYSYGGCHTPQGIYGVPSAMGSPGGSFDCSSFVSWAIFNGGFRLNPTNDTGCASLGTRHSRSDTNFVGKPGDLIWTPQPPHITMIVGVTENEYYVAEAASTATGMQITKKPIHDNSSTYVIDMDEYYSNNDNKTNKKEYEQNYNSIS